MLTPRQAAVFDCLQALAADLGYPPTSREIAARAKLSDTRARQHLAALEARGAIQRDPGTARGIRIVGRGA
ncbi:MAG: helix-turn-helix domain-containing protein [Thermoguttaceae bacterium]|jgi:repressor LexA